MKKSWFAATQIEFKLRVVFISSIFFGAFWCYAIRSQEYRGPDGALAISA